MFHHRHSAGLPAQRTHEHNGRDRVAVRGKEKGWMAVRKVVCQARISVKRDLGAEEARRCGGCAKRRVGVLL